MRVAGAERAWSSALFVLLVASSANGQPAIHVPVVTLPSSSSYDFSNSGSRESLAQSFYARYGDSYDFLVVFPAFDTGFGEEAIGLHWGVRNAVSGTGHPLHDSGSAFGSAARLKAVIDIGSLRPSNRTSVSDALGIIAHEVAHQWSGVATFKEPGSGLRSRALLGRLDAHWSFYLNSEASVLYGSRWKSNGDGTHTSTEARRRYSALDLYLMGLLSPGEVGPIELLTPAGASTFDRTALPPADGTKVTADARVLSVQDLIADMGPRSPGVLQAQNRFRAAFILLTRSGQPPTASQLEFVDQVRRQWANQFFFLTGGRALMETELAEVAPGPVSSNPSVDSGLDYLFSRQSTQGEWNDLPQTRIRDTQIALETLALFNSDPRAPSSIARGGQSLSSFAVNDVDSLSRQALGRVAAHLPAGSVQDALAQHGVGGRLGYGLSRGYQASIIDSLLAARALLAAQAPEPSLRPLVDFLLAAQGVDGGWPVLATGPSRLEVTAWTFELLNGLPFSVDAQKLNRAREYLRGRRQSDGSYRDETSSTATTAITGFALANARALSPTEAAQTATHVLLLQQTDGSWGGSVWETALALRFLRVALTPNLSLSSTDIQLSSNSVLDGEPVLAQVTVRNIGFGRSAGTILRAYGSDGQPMSEALTLPTLAGGESTTISVPLNTNGRGGSTQVFLVADADGALDELEEEDNRAAAALLVAPVPVQADLTVSAGSVSVSPATIRHFPALLTVNAEILNLGTTSVTGATIAVLVLGTPVGSLSVDIPGRGKRTVAIPVTVARSSGAVSLIVSIDPGNLVDEAREDNNDAAFSVPLGSGVDLKLAQLSLEPSEVDQGKDVTLTLQLQNQGVTAAQSVIELFAKDATGATVAALPSLALSLDGGEVATRTVLWRANASSVTRLEAVATAPGELNPSDNSASVSVVVRVSTRPNLLAVGGKVTLTPNPPHQSKAATASVTIRNSGSSTSGAFEVQFYEGDPAQGGRVLGQVTIPALASSAEAAASVPFTLTSSGQTSVSARLDSMNQVDEFDEDDNLAVVSFSPRSLPDLTLAAGDIVPLQPFPRAGEIVPVDVTVSNRGDQDAANVVLELFLGEPATGTSLGLKTLASLQGQSSITERFSWPAGEVSGPFLLVAVVNRNGQVQEMRLDNNRAERSVLVQDADLALSNVYFSPNGDGVKDDTQVLYRLSAAGAVEVTILDADQRLVRTLTGPSAQVGTIGWDGRDSNGKLARDGRYLLKVQPLGSASTLGTLTATLDTNRSPLYDAAGNPALLTRDNLELNHRVERQYGRPLKYTPDEQGIVFFSYESSGGGTGLDELGFYQQPIAGGPATRLTPPFATRDFDSRYGFDLSPDGLSLAYVELSRCDLGFCEALNVFDIPSQQERNILPQVAEGSDAFLSSETTIKFSPDGQGIVLVTTQAGFNTCEDRLEWISINSGQRRRLATEQCFSVREFNFTPDGLGVGAVLVDFTTDASLLMVRLDGSNAQRTSIPSLELRNANEGDGPFLQWYPEPSRAAVRARERDFHSNLIFSIDLPSGDARALSPEYAGAFALSPLGDALYYTTDGARCVPGGGESACGEGGGPIPPEGIRFSAPIGAAPRSLYEAPHFREVEHLTLSRSGTSLALGVEDADGFHYDAFSSLANLSSRFIATKPAGRSALVLKGTATDLNFESLELGYRRFGSQQPFSPLVRGASPVRNGTLTEWTPPSPGLFELQLLSRDLAGNVRRSEAKAAWSTQALISNASADPILFSPNGDGKLDRSTLKYTTGFPTTGEFVISNAQHVPMRHLPFTHLSAGEYSLSWDGRGDLGQVLPDGDYLASAEEAKLTLTVDATAPDVRLALAPSFNGGQQFIFPRVAVTQVDLETGIQTVCADKVGCPAHFSVPVVRGIATATARDSHMKEWSFERAKAGTTFPLMVGKSNTGDSLLLATPSARDLRGSTVRLRAEDHAANVAVTSPLSYDERLFALAVGSSFSRRFLALLSDSSGQSYPILPGLDWAREENGTARPVDSHKPGEPYVIVLDTTARSPLVRFDLFAEVDGQATPVPETDVTVEPWDDLIILSWRPSYVPEKLTIKAHDAAGRSFEDTLLFKRREPLEICVNSPTTFLYCSTPGACDDLEFDLHGETHSVLYDRTKRSPTGYPTEELTECRYELVDNVPGSDPFEIDVCNMFLGSVSTNGGLKMELVETFVSPVLSTQIFSKETSSAVDQWQLIAQAGPFEGSTSVDLPLTLLRPGSQQQVRFITQLADGTSVESPLRRREYGCQTNGFLVPNLHVTAQISRRDEPQLCSSSPQALLISVRASTGSAEATDVTSLVAQVLNQAKEVISSVALEPFAPGPLVITQGELLSTSLPEGVYSLRVVGENNLGQTSSSEPVPFVVDRTPPVAQLTSPAANTQVCLQRRVLSDPSPRERWELDLSGLVSDANLKGYAVYSRMGTAGGYSPVHTVNGGSFQGRLASLELPLHSSDYEVFVSAVDSAGNSSCSSPTFFHVVGVPEISGLQSFPPLFSPDGDGVLDSTEISFSLSEAANVTVELLSGEVAVGSILQASVGAGTQSFAWTGTLSTGTPLVDGRYTLRVTAESSCGISNQSAIPLAVDLTPPLARIDAPAAGQTAGATVSVLGEVADAHFNRYELFLSDAGAFPNWQRVGFGTQPSQGLLGSFETANLPAGVYTLRLTAEDKAGHTTTTYVDFQISTRELIVAYGVLPALISPNGDGELDTAQASFELKVAATVRLDLVDAEGTVLATPLASTLRTAGAHLLTLDAASLTGAPDGAYRLRLTATTTESEAEQAPLSLDRALPVATFLKPAAQSAVAGATSVDLDVSDAHLVAWNVAHARPSAGPLPLASGTGRQQGTVARLSGLEDGEHTLVLRALDGAGNTREQTVRFHSDATAPIVAFGNLAEGMFLTGASGAVPVTVELTETNLFRVSLETELGDGSRQLLLEAAALGPDGKLGDWDLTGVSDGPVKLVVSADDRAGNHAESAITLNVDSTPPVVELTAPRDTLVGAGAVLEGRIIEGNLQRYTFSVAAGTSPADEDFVEVASGMTLDSEIASASLANLNVTGSQTARLSVTDRAGNTGSDTAHFEVDITPPQPPSQLSAARGSGPRQVLLSWTASPSSDVIGYEVYRAQGSGTLLLVSHGLVATSTYVDDELLDGQYRYALVAVDGAGLRSASTGEAIIQVDGTPPTVALTAPLSGSRVTGAFEVQGTAHSASDFKEYRLILVRTDGSETQVARSFAPILGGFLATVDSASLVQGTAYVLRLEAEDLLGNLASVETSLTVDNVAPGAPFLTTAQAIGAQVQLAWQPSGDTDLAGYLVFRNGALANAPEGASFPDIRPFLIPAGTTTYTDSALPDGTFAYQVMAVDAAQLVSLPSNSLSVDLDNRPPSAVLVAPLAGAVLSGPVSVTAETADLDVASVRLEVRPAGQSLFVALGPPASRPPYRAPFDPLSFGASPFQLRAVATDRGGRTDPAPKTISVTVAPPPTVAIIHPASGAKAGGQVEVLGTVSGEGLREYELLLGEGSAPATFSLLTTGTSQVTDGLLGTFDASTSAHDAVFSLKLQAKDNFGRTVSTTSTFTIDNLAPGEPTLVQVTTEGASAKLVWTAPADSDLQEHLVLRDGQPLASVPSSSLSYTDSELEDGQYTYTVAASDRAKNRGAASNALEARIYRPVLDTVPGVVGTTPLTLNGGHAAALSSVTLFRDGLEVAITSADAEGRFSANVPLVSGTRHSLEAQATDAAGNVSVLSDSVSVTFMPPPPGVVTLFHTVSGSSVSLSWGINTTFAVSSFRILRADAGGAFTQVAQLGASARSFSDTNRPPGTYAYQAVAANAQGLRGTPSNTVSATVTSTAVPFAPQDLRVTAPPRGGVLELAWEYAGSPPGGFNIERAFSANGFFARINNQPIFGLTYADTTVTNNFTYWYRVRGVSPSGLEGPFSNLASGMARDTKAGRPPRLTAPTSPLRPVTLAATQTPVEGLADEKGLVVLQRDGVRLTATFASFFTAQLTPLTFTLDQTGPLWSSVDGRKRSFPFLPGGAAARGLAIQYAETDATLQLSDAAVDVHSEQAPLSPDGRYAVATGTSTSQSTRQLYLADLSSSRLRRLTSAASTWHEHSPEWSPDSTRLAYVKEDVANPGGTLAIVDLTSEQEQSLGVAADNMGAPLWDLAGTSVFVVRRPTGSPHTLVRVELSTGSITELLSAEAIARKVVRSPHSNQLALVVSAAGTQDLYIVQGDTGFTRRLTSDSSSKLDSSLAFSPDGLRLSLIRDNELVEVDPADGEQREVTSIADAEEIAAIQWTEMGHVVIRASSAETLDYGYPFAFDETEVPLDPGDNFFTAYSLDSEQRASADSRPIHVIARGGSADLTISAVAQPQVPLATGPASLVITIRNLGDVAAPAPEVSALLSGNDGSLRSTGPLQLQGTLQPNATLTARLPLDVSGLSGSQQVIATVDPARAIPDGNRANNTVTLALQVSLTADVSAALSVTPELINPGGAFTAEAALSNPSSPKSVTATFTLIDAAGETVASLGPPEAIAALPTGLTRVTRTLGTAGLLAGDYEVVLAFNAAGQPSTTHRVPVRLLADTAASLTLRPSRATYSTGEAPLVSGMLRNDSSNAFLTGAEYVLTVRDAAGVSAFTTVVMVPSLSMGARRTIESALPGTLPPGSYTATAEVRAAGGTLATASTLFSVLGQPVLAGTLEAEGQVTGPVKVRSGKAVAVASSVRNHGAAAASNVTLHVSLVDTDTFSIVHRSSFPVGTLGAGADVSMSLAIPTLDLPLKTYALILTADFDGLTQRPLSSLAVRLADGAPPRLAILNLTSGQFVRGAVMPQVQVTDDASGTEEVRVEISGMVKPLIPISGGALDGLWSETLDLPVDGTYTLTFSARDHEDNDGRLTPHAGNPLTLQLTRDSISPVIEITGVSADQHSGSALVPSFTVLDANLAFVSATLNGAAFPSGTPVDRDGSYMLVVWATDLAGNTTSATVRFSIDGTSPLLTVAGVQDGLYSPVPVTPVVTTSDASPNSVTLTLNGQPFTSGTTVTVEGSYLLLARAEDTTGHLTEVTLSFVIDTTPPSLTLTGVSADAHYRVPVSVTATAQDEHLLSTTTTLDGLPYARGTSISSEGLHAVAAIATDRAGNRAERTVAFTVDTTAPVIQLDGVSEGASESAFTITYSATDIFLASVSATLDGADFASGTEVTSAGAHSLVVTAVDRAGNTRTLTVAFQVTEPPASGPSFPYAVCAFSELVLQNQVQISGRASADPASVASNGSLSLKNQVVVSGDAVSRASMVLLNEVVVKGRAYHGGAFSALNHSEARGGNQRVTPAPVPCECGFDLEAQLESARSANDNALLTTLPNSQAWLTTAGGIKLQSGMVALPHGRYFLSSLTVSGFATLKAQPGAVVELFVEGNVLIQSQARLGDEHGGPAALRVISGAKQSSGGTVTVKDQAEAWAKLYAPEGRVVLKNQTRLTGAVTGNTVVLQDAHVLHFGPDVQAVPPPLTCSP